VEAVVAGFRGEEVNANSPAQISTLASDLSSGGIEICDSTAIRILFLAILIVSRHEPPDSEKMARTIPPQ
jgi:hypothetical protein